MDFEKHQCLALRGVITVIWRDSAESQLHQNNRGKMTINSSFAFHILQSSFQSATEDGGKKMSLEKGNHPSE